MMTHTDDGGHWMQLQQPRQPAQKDAVSNYIFVNNIMNYNVTVL